MKITFTQAEIQEIVSWYLSLNGINTSGKAEFDQYNRFVIECAFISQKATSIDKLVGKNDQKEAMKPMPDVIKKKMDLDVG